jgi:hypothetical protein
MLGAKYIERSKSLKASRARRFTRRRAGTPMAIDLVGAWA